MPKKPESRSKKPVFSRMNKENLLDLRICDLDLSIEKSPVAPLIKSLYRELDCKNILFKPHFWISDEWFCPDGIPGVAIPFFLMHKRLRELELENMLEVEGGDKKWCMKLLRHETGHALLNAYKLDKNKDWRRVFGNPNSKYPDVYSPKPYSKRFVINLPGWYAQSHPHEDWAETFAVWLNPDSDWQKRYYKWPALKKLHYVDNLFRALQDKKPLLRNKQTEHPHHKIRTTLREYYEEKRVRYGTDSPEFFDVDLTKLFSKNKNCPRKLRAASYIRKNKKAVIDIVEKWTGEYKYRINEVMQDMIKRCDELELCVENTDKDLLPELTACITMMVMNKLHDGGFLHTL